MEGLFRQNDIKKSFQFFINPIRRRIQKVRYKSIEPGNFAVLPALHVGLHHSCKHGVIRLAVGYVIHSAQRIRHGVYGRTAGITEGYARIG